MTASLRLHVAGTSHPGMARSINEDCFTTDGDLGLLAVADGLGGHPAGEVASRMAVDTVRGCFADPETTWPDEGLVDPDDGVARMLASFVLANQLVWERAERHPALNGMGTTLVVALVLPIPRRLVVAHAGDSRAYLHRGGRLQALTVDHNVACDAEMRARMHPDGVAKVPPRALTRAVGRAASIEPAVRVVELLPGDTIALVTDGLTVVVDDQEIAEVIDEHHDLAAAAATFIDLANDRGGPDNITIALGRWAPA